MNLLFSLICFEQLINIVVLQYPIVRPFVGIAIAEVLRSQVVKRSGQTVSLFLPRINHPDAVVLVVDLFYIVFPTIQIENSTIVFTGQFVRAISAAGGVGF